MLFVVFERDWRCLKCGTQFTPKIGEYQCPKCNSNSTISLRGLKEIEESGERQREINPRRTRNCPNCGAEMINGFLQERAPFTLIRIPVLMWRKGDLWTRGYIVDAYACPSCGKVDVWLNDSDLRENPVSK
jgi:predicted RNA-binding Zn-ribbon protein involved in translation (DUF1610 family)